MSLSPAQLQTLKSDLAANASTVLINGQPVAIKDVPAGPQNADTVAAWYVGDASPAFWVWRSAITRQNVLYSISDLPSVFDFGAFKSQQLPEQGTWREMFMGDNVNPSLLNFRNGVFNVFSGSAPQNAQRAHIFAICRRVAARIEKLFAVAPADAGGITVSANNGNTLASALGSTANPGLVAPAAFRDVFSGSDVLAAWNS